MAQPLINGEAYSWSQITLNLFGAPVAGVTAIKYEEKQEMENNYGAGNHPVSRGYGKIEPTASVTLTANETEALIAAVPSGRLQDIPEFDVTVSYIPKGTARIVHHTLHNCRFTNNSRDTKSGDTMIETELEMIISHISWK